MKYSYNGGGWLWKVIDRWTIGDKAHAWREGPVLHGRAKSFRRTLEAIRNLPETRS